MKDVLQKYVIVMLSSNKESKSIMYLNFLNIRNFDFLNFKMQNFIFYHLYSPFHIEIFKI
jgi:hypothetical protein